MKTLIQFFISILLTASMMQVMAQENLSLQQAIQSGLEHNYGIRLVKQDMTITENNNTIGNAGFLPQLSLAAGQSYTKSDSKQEYLTGAVNDNSGAKSDALNAGLLLNWTVFDGMRMFTRNDLLDQEVQKSELQLLFTVENTISNIYDAYYTIVQQMNQKKVLENTLDIDNKRLELATHKLETGAGSMLEVLQAQVDLHADSALYYSLTDLIERNKISINQLIGRTPNTSFSVNDTITVNSGLSAETLMQQMLERNTTLALGRKDEQIALLAYREIKGKQLPNVGLNLGYNFTNQNSESGFLITNQSLGLTYGITATMNIFDGFNARRETQNKQIEIETSRIKIELLTSELSASLYRDFGSFTNKLRLLAMEKLNLSVAKKNLEIASERFKLGDLSGIEFREAQRNYLTAEVRLLHVILEAKLLETELLRLAGMIAIEQ